MTPREKAGEMFDKYYNPLINLTTDIDYQNYLYKKDLCIQHAKKCALIAVSELTKENLRYDYIPFEGSRTEFYLQVEKELNKL